MGSPQGQGWRGEGQLGPHLHPVLPQAGVQPERFVGAAVLTQLAVVLLDHPAGIVDSLLLA